MFWAAYPVELAENLQSTEDLYAYVTNRLNIAPMFTSQAPLLPGVLVFPTALADSLLYIFVSDSANDTPIRLQDQATGAALSFSLPAQHAAIALVGRKAKKIIARYGF